MARRNENVPPDLERMLDEVSAATMRRSALWLDGRFTEEISSVKWNWTDGATRDIVDEGLLRSSPAMLRHHGDGSRARLGQPMLAPQRLGLAARHPPPGEGVRARLSGLARLTYLE